MRDLLYFGRCCVLVVLLVFTFLLLAPADCSADSDYYGVSIASIQNIMKSVNLQGYPAAYLFDGYPETTFGDGWLDDSYVDSDFLHTRLFPDIPDDTLEVGDIVLPLYVQFVTADRLISKPGVVSSNRSIDFESWFNDADLQMAWARVAARKDTIEGIAEIAAAVKEFSEGQDDALARDRLKAALDRINDGVPTLGKLCKYIVEDVLNGTPAGKLLNMVEFALKPSFTAALSLTNDLTISAIDASFGYSDLRQAYLLYYIGHKNVSGWNSSNSYPLVDMMMKASSGQDGNASGINQCAYWAGRPYDTGYPYTGGYDHVDGENVGSPVALLPKPVTGALDDYWGQWGKILFHASAATASPVTTAARPSPC